MSKTPNEPHKSDLDAFMHAFKAAATSRGLDIVHWLEAGVECRDQDGETYTLGLQNLFRSCSQRDRADWPSIIDHILQKVVDDARPVGAVALAATAEEVLQAEGVGLAVLVAALDACFQPVDDVQSAAGGGRLEGMHEGVEIALVGLVRSFRHGGLPSVVSSQ